MNEIIIIIIITNQTLSSKTEFAKFNQTPNLDTATTIIITTIKIIKDL